jgi:hypothetical protein
VGVSQGRHVVCGCLRAQDSIAGELDHARVHAVVIACRRGIGRTEVASPVRAGSEDLRGGFFLRKLFQRDASAICNRARKALVKLSSAAASSRERASLASCCATFPDSSESTDRKNGVGRHHAHRLALSAVVFAERCERPAWHTPRRVATAAKINAL